MLGTMKADDFRRYLHAEPFRPFKIHLADGGCLPVKHEDFVAMAPSGRELTVYLPDNSLHFVEMVMITRLEIPAGNGTKKSRR
jgi:hypothetical protein